MSQRSPRVALLATALILTPVSSARAQAAKSASALKADADREMDALEYDAALTHYEQAYALGHDPAVLYNQGRALQALDRFPEALERLQRFQSEAGPALRAKVPHLDALIADVRRRVSTLTLNCPVAGARVLVRGAQVGVTPLANGVALNAGSVTVEVLLDGYQPWKKSVELPGGDGVTVEVALVPRVKPKTVLVVRANVAGAQVFVDGARIGVAPTESVVSPGEHRVTLRRDGYESSESRAVVAEGARKELDLKLVAEPGVTSKWWFWTGIGAAVVAGAVVTYALTTEKKPGSGDLTPGQVAGPLRFRF